jgi:hypothetical protein
MITKGRRYLEKIGEDLSGKSGNVQFFLNNLAHLERKLGNNGVRWNIIGKLSLPFETSGKQAQSRTNWNVSASLRFARIKAARPPTLAAANALRERAGTPMTPDEQTYFDEQLKILREKIDLKQFDTVWSKGHAMRMEQAIEFALEENG